MKQHPAVRLERQRANLKRLETKARRIATLIASRKRSIRGLERSAAGAGPVPAPPIKAPKPPRAKRLDDAHLREMQEWADKAAKVLHVKAPTIRWAGTQRACGRVARAHMHTRDSHSYPLAEGRRKHFIMRRGTCCVNYDYVVKFGRDKRSLMAHEVTHLVRKHGHGSGHGAKFNATMRVALDALGATEDEAVEALGELLDDVEEGHLEAFV